MNLRSSGAWQGASMPSAMARNLLAIKRPTLICASVSTLLVAVALHTTQAHAQSSSGYVAPAGSVSSGSDSSAVAPAAPAAPAAAAAVPAAASAGSSSSIQQLQNVSVTGSAFSGPDAATSVPVTILKMSQLRQSGVTNMDQLMQRISMNNSSSNSSAGTTGADTGGVSQANMRGLGPDFTLVLLNGRRLADDAGTGTAPDLSTIPFDAIEQVQILRDGASALYGSDAVGGVINFITNSNYQGASLDVTGTTPTKSGGGQSRKYSGSWGYGDLNRDGFNVMGTLSYQKGNGLNSDSRGYVRHNDPQQGVFPGSSFNFPGNYIGPSGGMVSPLAGACGGKNQLNDGGVCKYNYSKNQWISDPFERTSMYTDGSFKMGQHAIGSLSFFWARDRDNQRAAPGDVTAADQDYEAASLYPSSPYYPKGSSGTVPLYYRTVPLGNRVSENTNDNKRILFDVKGNHALGWNYDTAVYYNRSSLHTDLTNGYENDNLLENDFNDGTIDPFSSQLNPVQAQALKDAEVKGRVWTSVYQSYNWDGKITRSVGDWFGAGPVDLALGADFTHEKLDSDVSVLGNRSKSSGYTTGDSRGSRNEGAVWTELNVPIFDSLSMTFSDRYDKYAHFSGSSSPKVSFRYQPFNWVVFRGSYGKGFHAPSLYEMYEPQQETFTETLTDPEHPNAAPAQYENKTGGNPDLESEKSKNWTLGAVFSPLQNLSISTDLWWIRVDKYITEQTPQWVLRNAPDQVDRNADGSIQSINTPLQNIGSLVTNGVDVGLQYALPTSIGMWSLDFNGTYTNKYQENINGQKENGMGWDVLGINGPQVNFRWQHTVSLDWSNDGWSAGFVNEYKTGFRDEDEGGYNHGRVASYTQWDGHMGYQFKHGPQITVGVDNMFNRKPPFSDQLDLSTSGYIPQYYDLMGRTVFGEVHWAF